MWTFSYNYRNIIIISLPDKEPVHLLIVVVYRLSIPQDGFSPFIILVINNRLYQFR